MKRILKKTIRVINDQKGEIGLCTEIDTFPTSVRSRNQSGKMTSEAVTLYCYWELNKVKDEIKKGKSRYGKAGIYDDL